jgi:hypothetical protein
MSEEGYTGRAVLVAGGRSIPVEVALGGYFEPLDGRYHWGGRLKPADGLADLVRAGTRDAALHLDGADPAPLRMIDVDPWGGVTVRATGAAPWTE